MIAHNKTVNQYNYHYTYQKVKYQDISTSAIFSKFAALDTTKSSRLLQS